MIGLLAQYTTLGTESVQHIMAYTFTFPLTGIGLVILGFGIVYQTTHKLTAGLAAAFIMSLLADYISLTLLSSAVSAVVLFVLVISIYEDLFASSHHNDNHVYNAIDNAASERP